MEDFLAEYENAYDGKVDLLEVGLNVEGAAIQARVVVRAAKWRLGVPAEWFRIGIVFSKIELVRIGQEWLEGGGCVLYDGARLLNLGLGRAVLNLDPGAAWRATGVLKPEGESAALFVGQCELSIEPG
jgi:hypothetical protein